MNFQKSTFLVFHQRKEENGKTFFQHVQRKMKLVWLMG